MTLTFKYIHFPYTGSTNDDLKELAQKGAHEGTVIRADAQTLGRGRRSRVWSSPPGNLYMSILLRPQGPTDMITQLSFVSALAVASGLETLLPPPHSLHLKWPNDILYQGKKIGGILIESQNHGTQNVDWVVVGIGINLISHPEGTTYPATNLLAEIHLSLNPDRVMNTLLNALDHLYTQWQTEGFDAICQRWCARAYGLGQEIKIVSENETITGTYLGIDTQGSLKIKLEDTTIKTVRSGDVFFKSLDYTNLNIED